MKKTIISRTISDNHVKGLCVDLKTRTVIEWEDRIPVKYDTPEKALAFVRKNNPTIVSILSVEKVENLIGMYESDFIANGVKFDERSKETRGLITKEISVKSAKCMVVDSDRKVIDVTYPNCDSEKAARKAASDDDKLFVQLIVIEETKQLYGMETAKFESLAKPMKDRFTLA